MILDRMTKRQLVDLLNEYMMYNNHSKSPEASNPISAFHAALELVTEWRQEHFIVLYLDVKNRVIRKELIFKGTLGATLIHPREVFSPAIANRASSIIMLHNHPGHDLTPSDEDR